MNKEIVVIDKLVFGGQGLAKLKNNKKVFVWGVLPGEVVEIRITKNKHDYAEAIADRVIKASPERIKPEESNYLATSPWQIMSYVAENQYKREIISEVFTRENIELPDYEFVYDKNTYYYRNKMEYSFWGDDDGLHMALHHRGGRGKDIVKGSKLAMLRIDEGALAILAELRKLGMRASQLKTMVVRTNQSGEVVASLFVKTEDFTKLKLPKILKGLIIHYSNPKSPASIITRTLYILGNPRIKDKLLGIEFEYNSDSFFQVNLPIFETALNSISQYLIDGEVVDMYGGVGSIGLSVSKTSTIVELDESSVNMAKINAHKSKSKIIHASAEKSLEYITTNTILIVDPPRAGLHKNVISRILDQTPKQVIYLSCNAVTQARDIAYLKDKYTISRFEGYNFFPRTPHIETMAILQRNSRI